MATFFLYLTPDATTTALIQSFYDWCKSNKIQNKASEFPVHCTLSKRFEEQPVRLSHYEKAISDTLSAQPLRSSDIELRRVNVESNAIFISIEDIRLRRFVQQVILKSTASKRGVRIVPTDRELHLSLAYYFLPPQRALILEQIDKLLPMLPAQIQWSVCIYEKKSDTEWEKYCEYPLS
ncbi:MAG: hypothetical protein JJT94_16515 [Bernardetiaceae bacterium]|nr:hypothetical protein [Bernardetiaceae bacterium]